MTFAIVDGPTIKKGESLSGPANCSAGRIMRITVPQEYTEADLTFQVSTDGKMFNDLYSSDGGEISVSAHPNTSIVIQEDWVAFCPYVKLRSGTAASPVNQESDCKFSIAIDT
jgi:hypothetical protein